MGKAGVGQAKLSAAADQVGDIVLEDEVWLVTASLPRTVPS
jgi:hypothetical protein